MIRVKMFRENGRFLGFSAVGHADAAEYGQDIVCAAVSSAAYLTANTVTDVCRCRADVSETDGKLTLRVTADEAERCADILEGFALHLSQLRDQYPQNIHYEISEV